MFADRRVSQQAAFLTALVGQRRADQQAKPPIAKGTAAKGTAAKGTITKGAAEQALRRLDEPGTSHHEQALVVQRFLDSQDAAALSPAARATLLAFIEQQSAPATGDSVAEVRRGAGDAGDARRAHAKVVTLLNSTSSSKEAKERYAKVAAWLDAAEADMAQAGARLAALATGTHSKAGGTGSGGPRRPSGSVTQELDALVAGSRKGDVTPRDVDAVRQWLSRPLPGSAAASSTTQTSGDAVGSARLRPARLEALRGAFQRLDEAGTLSWSPGSVLEHHLGVRFVRVELSRERRPDGFTFTAWLPIGALTPGASAKDPNQVSEFFVERTGGFAGMTFSVGPIRADGGDHPADRH